MGRLEWDSGAGRRNGTHGERRPDMAVTPECIASAHTGYLIVGLRAQQHASDAVTQACEASNGQKSRRCHAESRTSQRIAVTSLARQQH